MVKISEITQELKISKDQLFDTLFKMTQKKYSDKTTQIPDPLFDELKKYIDSNESSKGGNSGHKIIKKEEMSKDEDGFLSSLGIESPSKNEGSDEDDSQYEEIIHPPVTSKPQEQPQAEKKTNFKKIERPGQTIKFHDKVDQPVVTDDPPKSLLKTAETSKPAEKTDTGVTFQQKTNTVFQSKSEVKAKPNNNFSSRPNTGYNNNNNNYNQKNKSSYSQQNVQPLVKKEYAPTTSSSLKKKDEISMGDTISLKEFAEKMGVALPEVIKKFLSNKIIVSINSTIDFDTAVLIAEELEVKINRVANSVSIDDVVAGNLQSILDQDKQAENLETRSPIVTIMGHVDHGKTKLLDYMRKSNVGAGEAGGITQSIGASQILHNGKKITFLDTPGHELFTSLRARGAKITDIVIIVIAADEGMKQQTIEAINHAKEAGVPIIVAITKIDKGMGNMDMIKGQLAEQSLVPEDWGGTVVLCPVSAITGQGVDEMLDIILLQSEIIDLKFNPNRMGVGVVVEAHKDTKKGVTTSLILMTGSLNIGDIVVVNDTYGKIRKMVDWKGHDVKTISGGDPAMILGIQELPEPGRLIETVKTEKDATARVSMIREKQKSISKQNSIQNILSKISQGENVLLKFILKADSFGSLEALKYVCSKIEMPANIEMKIIHADVGQISESDALLADASGAVIIGFNVESLPLVKKKADNMKVEIKEFYIIYEIIDYIDRLAKGLVKIEEKEVYIGKLEILGIFFTRGNEMILGGKVIDGKIVNNAFLKSFKGTESIGNGRVTSLKKEKENVNEIGTGYECGLKVKVNKKPEVGDILEFYVME